MALHIHTVDVSFGDCDPVGLVFYPRFFAWFDACFHAWLRTVAGGHAHLCRSLSARGIGLMTANARFLAPVEEGVRLRISLDHVDWQDRAVQLEYRASVDGQPVLEGFEVRGVFVERDGKMRAAATRSLRDLLGAGNP